MSSISSLSFSPLVEVSACPASPPSPPPFFWTRFCSCSGNRSSFPERTASAILSARDRLPSRRRLRTMAIQVQGHPAERRGEQDEHDHETGDGCAGGGRSFGRVGGFTRRGRPP